MNNRFIWIKIAKLCPIILLKRPLRNRQYRRFYNVTSDFSFFNSIRIKRKRQDKYFMTHNANCNSSTCTFRNRLFKDKKDVKPNKRQGLTAISSSAVPPQFVFVVVRSNCAPSSSATSSCAAVIATPAINERKAAVSSCSALLTISWEIKHDKRSGSN